ncbi:MAG: DUF721 domain-containing protein [Candidatus Abawacabacteria bacterium]|nr:DUF721 domain-containing protein [Candidatus Abawacabacteria bacterium]
MLRRLVDLLPKKLAKHGLTRPVLAAQIVESWDTIVENVCPKAKGKCQAISFNSKNTLIVRCEHSALAHELALCEQSILAHYQKLFPATTLQLRFQSGTVNRAAHMPSP